MSLNSLLDLEEIHGLLIPRKDTSACKHIRKTGKLAWNPAFTGLKVWNELKPGSVVFDIGAFIGDTAPVFLDRQCEVHAFEPKPDMFVCLLHNCPRAFCYNLAIGDGTRFDLSNKTGNMGGQSLLPGQRYSIRLDDLNVERLDVLKIDVEGFELKVLEGAAETIRRFHPIIHIELNVNGLKRFGATPEITRKMLANLGYLSQQVVHHHDEGYNSHCDMICR
jgi:FkbM family methyltransferase